MERLQNLVDCSTKSLCLARKRCIGTSTEYLDLSTKAKYYLKRPPRPPKPNRAKPT
jgi:hypothetical protein